MSTASPESGDPVLLDARGQRCPLPVIRLGRLVRDLPAGTLVRLLATDPAARSDVPAFCRMRGHELVAVGPGAGPGGDPGDPGSPGHLAEVTAYDVRVSASAPAGVR